VLYVASQHVPSSFTSCTVTGSVSERVGIGRLSPLPLAVIFALAAAPDLSTSFPRPSGVRSWSL